MKKKLVILIGALILAGILFSGCTQTTDKKATDSTASVSDAQASKETSIAGLTATEKEALAEEDLPALDDVNSLDIEAVEIGSFEMTNPFPATTDYKTTK